MAGLARSVPLLSSSFRGSIRAARAAAAAPPRLVAPATRPMSPASTEKDEKREGRRAKASQGEGWGWVCVCVGGGAGLGCAEG